MAGFRGQKVPLQDMRAGESGAEKRKKPREGGFGRENFLFYDDMRAVAVEGVGGAAVG